MIVANGWVTSVVEPLTIGKGAVAGPGESAPSTIHTVVPGVLQGEAFVLIGGGGQGGAQAGGHAEGACSICTAI